MFESKRYWSLTWICVVEPGSEKLLMPLPVQLMAVATASAMALIEVALKGGLGGAFRALVAKGGPKDSKPSSKSPKICG